MWGVKFNKKIDTYCFFVKNPQSGYLNPTSKNGNEQLSSDDFKKIRKEFSNFKNIFVYIKC